MLAFVMIERYRPSFRDITTDLKDRLREALALRNSLATQTKENKSDIEMLMRMLDREEQRRKAIADGETAPQEALPEFIFKAIQMRPMSRDDLRYTAANAGYRVDGRHIHATTFNLKRSGRIVELEDGLFASADSDLVKSALGAPSH